MSSDAIDGRKRLGTILLLLGAVPSALFGVGLTLGGLCMIPLSVSDPNTIDLGAAFAGIFALLMLPAGILLLLFLLLSRLSNRFLAAMGAVGNLLFGWLGIVYLFVASHGGRAVWGGGVGVLSAGFLLTGYSSLVGHWLRRRLPPGWIIGSVALSLMTVSVLIGWEWSVRSSIQVLEGHTGHVRAVAWSPDGKKLASESRDQTLMIWDTERGEALRTLGANTDGGCLAWSPDGAKIASCSGDTVFLWDAETGEQQSALEGHTEWVTSLAWSPIGGKLASASTAADDKTVIVWNAQTGEPLRILETNLGGDGLALAWSPGGTQLAFTEIWGHLTLWDAGTGEEQQVLGEFGRRMTSVSWSPDGTKLAASVEDEVAVFDVETGDQLRTFAGPKGTVHSVAWSPDGERLASGYSDGAVFVWDAEKGKRLRTLREHIGAVWSVAWSPDGTRLASGSSDNTVILWKMAP